MGASRTTRLVTTALIALAVGPLVACDDDRPGLSDTTGSLSPSTSTDPSAGRPSKNTDAAAVIPHQPRRNFLSTESQWRLDVTDAPIADDSALVVSSLARQVSSRYGGTAAFNVGQYNTSFYEVPRDTRGIDVTFDDCQGKGREPEELSSRLTNEPFRSVPLPANAIPATGTDGELTIWQPSTDRLWEFWKANRQQDGWHACWGGRIDDVSTSAGQFPADTGVSASGLAIAPGTVRIKEMQAGTIDHALSLAVVDAAHYTEISYPAQRSDGNLPPGTPGAVREGQRLRLDQSVDVDALHLTPIAAAIAKAAQHYGFIVTDRSGAVAVTAESSAGVVAAGGTDPWTQLMGGQPSYAIMAGFPWDKLQALPVDWGAPPAG